MIFSRDIVLGPDDLKQIADIGEWLARVKKGDEAVGTHRLTIRARAKLDAIRHVTRRRHLSEFPPPVLSPLRLADFSSEPEGFIAALRTERTPEDIVGEKELVEKALAQLAPREQLILESLLAGYEQKAIAREHGISKARVSQIVRRLAGLLGRSAEGAAADIH